MAYETIKLAPGPNPPVVVKAGHPTRILADPTHGSWIAGAPMHGILIEEDAPTGILGVEVFGCRNTGVKAWSPVMMDRCWIHHNLNQGVQSNRQLIMRRSVVEYNGCNTQWPHGLYLYGPRNLVRNSILRHNGGLAIAFVPAAPKWGLLAGGGTVTHSLLLTGADMRRRAVYMADPALVRIVRCTVDGTVYTYKGGYAEVPLTKSNAHIGQPGCPKFVCDYQSLYWLREKPAAPIGAYDYDARLTRDYAKTRWDGSWMYSAYGEPTFKPMYPGDPIPEAT